MNKYYTIYQLIVLFCIGLLGPLHLPWVANAQAGIIREFQGGFVTFLAKKAGTGPGTKTTNMDVGEKSIPPRDEYWLDYWMKWSPGWIDGEGGKLPGLAGGTGTTGCLPINPEGWSARFMWDPMRLYIYHQNRIKACGDGPKLDIKPDLNEALKVDKWFRITERVKVNTPNEPNGVVQVWINGKQVFSKRDWRLRGDVDASTALVDRFLISVFRGGKDESWAVDVDTTVEFKPFYLLDCQPVFTGDENSRPICSGSISDEQDKAACIPAGNEFRVESVRASGDDGHVPTNTCDNDLNTRWSAEGDGQWIEFDLGAEQFIDKLAIAFFKGDQRKTFFDFQLSNNATDWSTISSPQSSGNTPPGEKETFDLNPNTFARYVRLFGHGNSGSDSERGWNSITDVNIFPAPPPPRGSELAINTVSASSDDGHIPMNTLDNDLNTRWSAEGQSEWIEFDLGAVKFIGKLAIAFYKGDKRITSFEIQSSTTATSWSTILVAQSSGTTLQQEIFDVPNTFARYVRLLGHGHRNRDSNSSSDWNSITEVDIFPAPLPPTGNVLAINDVRASSDDGHIPMNTLDNNLTTRWSAESAEGRDQWIEYDLGTVKTIDKLAIAFHKGDQRIAFFELQVSDDATVWSTISSARSSGTTLQKETFDIPNTSARYVRLLGHGNSGSEAERRWNSITEVEIFPAGPGNFPPL